MTLITIIKPAVEPVTDADLAVPARLDTTDTGQTTTVIFDDLIDLIHSVDPVIKNHCRCLSGIGGVESRRHG